MAKSGQAVKEGKVDAPSGLPDLSQPLELSQLAPELERVFNARLLGSDRSFLEIQARPLKMDPIARDALASTKAFFDTSEDEVVALIQREGLATEISKVTKRLNRMRLSNLRRHVLKRTYVRALKDLLTAKSADPDDTLGFAEAVLFYQEQDRPKPGTGNGSDPSPLTKFFQSVVGIVLAQNRVDLSPLEVDLLVADLRRSDLSLQPGRIKPAVMDRLDRIIKQGANPALVEKYAQRNEVKPGRFTPRVKEAMVEYLLDRGVQVTDLALFDARGYDEYFALAYERAVSRASDRQDPLDNARLNGRGGALSTWDFTVETFDEIEEQGVVKENILAAGAIDYIYELGERMSVFLLADALVLGWARGAIDVADGDAAARLYRYWKLSEDRSSPEERAMLYKRVLNKGDAKLLSRMVVNEHFPRLWHNLMAEVAKYIDKTEQLDEGASETSPVSRSAIYQATKELQYNLTENGTGMAHMQARELYAQLQEAFDLLGDPEVVAHFGGLRRKSLWTVIERLSRDELGTTPNIAAIRTLAVDGNSIFRWIAEFDEATATHDEFMNFLEAAESYILNMALVGSDLASFEDDEDDWGEDDWEDDFEDDFDDF